MTPKKRRISFGYLRGPWINMPKWSHQRQDTASRRRITLSPLSTRETMEHEAILYALVFVMELLQQGRRTMRREPEAVYRDSRPVPTWSLAFHQQVNLAVLPPEFLYGESNERTM